MTAALVTLVFLSTLWMLVVLGAAVLDSSGAKILAALKGQSASPAIVPPPRPGSPPALYGAAPGAGQRSASRRRLTLA